MSISAQSCGDFSPSEVAVYYAARAPKVRQHGHEWRGPCPIHSGTGDNFSVNAETGMWYCHSQCGRGGSMFDLEMGLTNTDFPPAANEVRRVVGRPALRQVDREPEMKWGLPGWSHGYLGQQIEAVEQKNQWKHTAIYPYYDAAGRISYVKVRFIDKQNDKTFRQFGLTSKMGWKSRKQAGKTPILYRLNTLVAAEEIFIVNGEKAADRGVAELGIAATCTPDGEGKWWGDYTKALIGKLVRIVIDHDEKGELHGKVVSEALAPHVREVKIIRLPGLPLKGDLWDWIEAGGTRDQLDEIVAKTPAVDLLPTVAVVRKYENPIEFPETHKLWLDTNSKPVIRATDDQATFNRLHPIPFTVTIPDAEIDKSLPRKLLAEAEGILAWAVEGAKEWRRNGLGRPPEVASANDDWRAENDQFGRFIEDCCVVGDSFSSRARPLYLCYREWTEGAGETAITETMFGKRLKGRGFTKEDRCYGAVYVGIAPRVTGSISEEKD